jgi:hypothetical protein
MRFIRLLLILQMLIQKYVSANYRQKPLKLALMLKQSKPTQQSRPLDPKPDGIIQHPLGYIAINTLLEFSPINLPLT